MLPKLPEGQPPAILHFPMQLSPTCKPKQYVTGLPHPELLFYIFFIPCHLPQMQNNINIYGLLEGGSGAGGHKSINTHTVLGELLREWKQDTGTWCF